MRRMLRAKMHGSQGKWQRRWTLMVWDKVRRRRLPDLELNIARCFIYWAHTNFLFLLLSRFPCLSTTTTTTDDDYL